MKDCFLFACLVGLSGRALAQNPAASPKIGESRPSSSVSADSSLKDMFESKIKVEWEAIKNKDKKAYGDLLADDYEGVEVDGRGERNKIQAVNEMPEQNVFSYTRVYITELWMKRSGQWKEVHYQETHVK